MILRKNLGVSVTCATIAIAAFVGGYLWWAHSPVNSANFARIREGMSLRDVGRLLGPVSSRAESDLLSGRWGFNDLRWYQEQTWGRKYEYSLISGAFTTDENGKRSNALCYCWGANEIAIMVVFDPEGNAVGASLCRRRPSPG